MFDVGECFSLTINYNETKGENYMNYYDEEISKIDFYGIKYITIKTVNDYIFLEREIDNLLAKLNKNECLITAENLKNMASEEKERSISVHFPLTMSLLFGICAFVLGCLFSNPGGLGRFMLSYIICIAMYFIVVVLLLNRANMILNIRNKKITFYDTICKIIRNKN